MASTILTATAAASFISSLGVNTHLDFQSYGYQNLTITEQAIQYLGFVNLRDSGESTADTQIWSQVAAATGAKFDDYMPEGSPTTVQNTLTIAASLAHAGVLNYLEGGNEEDDAYAIANGNSLGWSSQFQHTVYATGQSLGLPVINMSYGAGWTATNNWEGDYASVGDLSAYCNYGNAHTYPVAGQMPDATIQRLDSLARLAAASRPIITSELGWSLNTGFTQSEVAQYVVQGALDGWKDGNTKTYFYALFDDSSGQFGLMNATGTPKPAGTALHNLTTLLADTATTLTPGSVSYTLSGAQGGEKSLLLQKSDGSYWLALWDETDNTHSVTLTLSSNATQIAVYDPVASTNIIELQNNGASVTVALNGDPLLMKLVGVATVSTASTSGAGSSSSNTTSSGTTSTSANTGSSSTGSTAPAATSNDLSITVPAATTVAAGSTSSIPGISINDPWAAGHSGSMALNLSTSKNAPLLVNGKIVSGTLSGSFAQLNADLATLSYTAGAGGGDAIRVNVWNQAGVQTTQQITVTIK